MVQVLCALAVALALAPAADAAGPGGTAPATGAPSTSGAKHAKHTAVIARILQVSCVPSIHCSANLHQVTLHGTLLISGTGLSAGMSVAFPQSPGARIGRGSPAGHLRRSAVGLVVTVPEKAHSGRIMVLLSGSRHTGSFGPITIFKHALHPPPAPKPPTPAPVTSPAPTGSAPSLEGQGMWVWYISKSDGGSIPAIVAQAKAAGVTTLFIKSSDGTNFWEQFTPALVAELHADGLHVCAWQYVYGTNPEGEAAMGAQAVADGADCLVIDAEEQYERRYAAAQTYITDLRAKIGPSYPLALASFPYVYDHQSFPYSVFMGPEGAQYNAPQMYWKAIGDSVDTVYANTYISNRIYGRAIYPLGMTYDAVSAEELLRFREEAVDYGATGWSFWDWQETRTALWPDLATPLAPLSTVTPNGEYPQLQKGEKGDQVLWMQEHLASAVPAQETTGIFEAKTQENVTAFQSAHAIAPSGIVEAATWQALLALPAVAVKWTGGGPSG